MSKQSISLGGSASSSKFPPSNKNMSLSKTSKRLPARTTKIVTAGLGALIVGIGVFTGWSVSGAQARSAEYAAEITNLERRLEDLQNPEIISTEVAQQTLKDSSEAGKTVAEAQNSYGKMEEFDENKIKEIASSLDPYMAEDSYSARAPWFAVSGPELPEGMSFTWSYVPTYDVSSREVDAVWLAKDDSNGEILAWATGLFNAEEGTFSGMRWAATNVGETFMQGTLSGDLDNPEAIEGEVSAVNPGTLTPEDIKNLPVDPMTEETAAGDELGEGRMLFSENEEVEG